MKAANLFDVIIIGGSYSGLSAAMALGRSLRKVLVVDNGQPCNRFTPHSHNFITHDGKKPAEIAQMAREQVLRYGTVKILDATVTAGSKTDDGFSITTSEGNNFNGKKLIFATGIRDILPQTKGFAECWGISLIHCPYCHGYEVRNEKTAIIGNGNAGFDMAKLISNWTKDLTVFTNGKQSFTEDQIRGLVKHNIDVVEEEILELEHENGQLKKILLKGSCSGVFKAAYFRPPFEQQSQLIAALGCELTEMGHIKVNNMQQTNIGGIYACGDNCSPMRSVANAVGTGAMAGAAVNKELIEEDFG